jgi:hypothetical protein
MTRTTITTTAITSRSRRYPYLVHSEPSFPCGPGSGVFQHRRGLSFPPGIPILRHCLGFVYGIPRFYMVLYLCYMRARKGG